MDPPHFVTEELTMIPRFLLRELPQELEPLTDLALNLRFTWGQLGEKLWRAVSPEIWEQTENPWLILQSVPLERFEELVRDPEWMDEFRTLVERLDGYRRDPGWYGATHSVGDIKRIAYFSMEFGLGEAMPLYAGGLGVLAGDHLKAAADLGVPIVGVGLLYQEGYFRQLLDSNGWQHEAYPYNDPGSLPVQPVLGRDGTWLQVQLGIPGRTVRFRVWQATVGRVALYLLDSNDPLNGPVVRGITSKLYGGGTELRLMQEMVLGIGGCRVLQALGINFDVCHLNEGHPAFAVLERARLIREKHDLSFWEALSATRAGNVFTTHTPVPAGFDTFSPLLIKEYFAYWTEYLGQLGISIEELLALGRKNPSDESEPFNMAYLAMRGCASANGVSRLHGEVSRRIFSDLYPGWPEREVPVKHVTNGVHTPSWNSPAAFDFWTGAYGSRACWLGDLGGLCEPLGAVADEDLWALREHGRANLVDYVRRNLAQLRARRPPDLPHLTDAESVLDPGALTLGFARRFTEYKRPNLLLHDSDRLARLLTDSERPVQLVMAGKAHPADNAGKRMIRQWAEFVKSHAVSHRAVFLEDYDMSVAQKLVQGVDVWINTPRRPWEASGTSGMKILANGGINLSVRDGWWAEAYSPEVGWAIGEDSEHYEAGRDAREADELYRVLEEQVVPEFFERDSFGIPRAWVSRMRASMSLLTVQYSSNRMVREYVEKIYLPAAREFRRRVEDNCARAVELHAWKARLDKHWHKTRFGECMANRVNDSWSFQVKVFLGELSPGDVRVELYADSLGDEGPVQNVMELKEAPVTPADGCVYIAGIHTDRPAEHFTPRIVAFHPDVAVPIETALIRWQR
jgi:starch phosphorylase